MAPAGPPDAIGTRLEISGLEGHSHGCLIEILHLERPA